MAESSALPFRKASIFSRIFPAPQYLKMPRAGLEISEAHLRAVSLRLGDNGAELRQKGKRRLPEGTISAGEIVKKDVLIDELKAFSKELGLHFVQATVPDEKAYLFKIQLPNVTDKDIRENIEFKLEENVPIAPAEALFEYRVIDRAKHTGAEHLDVSVSVLQEEAVAIYSEVLAAAGLVPLSFFTPSQALLKAFVPRKDGKTYLLIHFGTRKTTIAVASEGIIRYASTIAVGADTLTSVIERSFNVKKEDAAKMKLEKYFIKNEKNLDFFSAIVGTISVISDEARKVMSYWDNHAHKTNEVDQRIEKVFLSGGDAALKGFDEYLSAALGARVEVGNAWKNLLSPKSGLPPLPLQESLEYAVPIGLAAYDLFS